MITAPCKDCTDRILGCHSLCNKYKEFKERVDSTNTMIRDSKKIYKMHSDYVLEQKEKYRRSKK